MSKEDSKVDIPRKTIKKALVCNCDDEFKTTPCPIHFREKVVVYDTIVTDSNMVEEEIRQWTGLTFYCPQCKEASIMDFMSFCGNCGVKIKMQSKMLTDLINKASSK